MSVECILYVMCNTYTNTFTSASEMSRCVCRFFDKTFHKIEGYFLLFCFFLPENFMVIQSICNFYFIEKMIEVERKLLNDVGLYFVLNKRKLHNCACFKLIFFRH